MSIVRSLLVSIGFVVNRTQQTQATRSIAAMILQLTAATASFRYLATQAITFYNDLAQGTLKVRDLSQALGVPLQQLLAMQKAAVGFRINESQFQGALNVVNTLFQDMKAGGSILRRIGLDWGFSFDGNRSPIDTLNTIVKEFGKIGNEQERIAQFGKVFGKDLAVSFSNVSQNFERYQESVRNFQANAREQANAAPALERYEQAINSFLEAFQAFKIAITTVLLPPINFFIETLTVYLNLVSGVVRALKSLFSFKPSHEYGLDFFKRIYEGFPSLNRDSFFIKPFLSNPGSSSPTVNNEITVTVPYGTSEEQATYISQEVRNAVDGSIFAVFQQINNNYPLVEA